MCFNLTHTFTFRLKHILMDCDVKLLQDSSPLARDSDARFEFRLSKKTFCTFCIYSFIHFPIYLWIIFLLISELYCVVDCVSAGGSAVKASGLWWVSVCQKVGKTFSSSVILENNQSLYMSEICIWFFAWRRVLLRD